MEMPLWKRRGATVASIRILQNTGGTAWSGQGVRCGTGQLSTIPGPPKTQLDACIYPDLDGHARSGVEDRIKCPRRSVRGSEAVTAFYPGARTHTVLVHVSFARPAAESGFASIGQCWLVKCPIRQFARSSGFSISSRCFQGDAPTVYTTHPHMHARDWMMQGKAILSHVIFKEAEIWVSSHDEIFYMWLREWHSNSNSYSAREEDAAFVFMQTQITKIGQNQTLDCS